MGKKLTYLLVHVTSSRVYRHTYHCIYSSLVPRPRGRRKRGLGMRLHLHYSFAGRVVDVCTPAHDSSGACYATGLL